MARSGLAAAETFGGARFERWDAALAAIATAARAPQVVVLDELPYRFEQEAEVEGVLQTAWDRSLRQAPVLLIAAIGSDLATMEALTTYGRPLYGRVGREIALDPLSPADVGTLTGLDEPVLSPSTPTSSREASPRSQRSGSFTRLADRTGLHRSSLELSLRDLSRRRVVERLRPLSARPSRRPRPTSMRWARSAGARAGRSPATTSLSWPPRARGCRERRTPVSSA